MTRGFSELARKSVHVAMGGFALLLAYLTWWQALVLAIAAFAHNALLLPRYGRKRLFRGEAGERGRDLGILLYPVSIAALILAFPRHLEIVAAAWGLLAFGDGFATIVGTTVGGPRLPWNRGKSWSGYLAFLAFGFLAAWFLYAWVLDGQLRLSADLGAWMRRGGAFPPWIGTEAMRGTFAGDVLVSSVVRTHAGLLAVLAATTLLAATLESLPLGVDDNLLVPLVAGGFLWVLTLFDPAAWAANRSAVASHLPWAIAINAALAAAAYAARSVSLSGVVGGILMGGALFAFGGWRSFLMLVVFFVLGTATTKMGYARKAALGIAQEKGGRRGARNAVANCGMGALLAWVAATTPYAPLALLGLVAAFATAACDTVSSEIGQAYGRTPYLVTTLRRVPHGTDGAVSLEGTLAGIVGGAVVAGAGWLCGLVTPAGAALVVVAAFFGSTLESYMGAAWERSRLIDNEAINFANTLAGSLFAIGAATLAPSLPLLAPG